MAAELVGGALLSAFVQVAFDKLASPQFVDFFRRRKFDEKLLANLNIMLHSINSLADDAEQKQFRDPHVKAWLFAVKEAVFDAEDLLDEINYELTRCEVEAESQSQSITYKYPFLHLEGVEDTLFSWPRILGWMLNGVLSSLVIFFLTTNSVLNQAFRRDGKVVDFEILGVTMYTCVVWTVNCQMALSINIFLYGAASLSGMYLYWSMITYLQQYPQHLTGFLWKHVLPVVSIGL